MAFHLTMKSRNPKVGRIGVTTSEADTCPHICPFNHANKGGCYAENGPLKWHWDKVSRNERGTDWDTFIQDVKKIKGKWRHNQAGDLPSKDRVNLDAEKCDQLSQASKGTEGFTYTHYDTLESKTNRAIIRDMNQNGFTVNLSANDLDHADKLSNLGIAPVATVLPTELERENKKVKGETIWLEELQNYRKRTSNLATTKGRKVVICPATYSDNITCKDCMLCQKRDRKVIVGFPAHGTGKKKASNVACG